MCMLERFLRDESGATAIEYALIVSLISIVIVAAAQGIGITLQGTFQAVNNGFAGK